MGTLCAVFLQHVHCKEAAGEPSDELEHALRSIYETARSEWPEIDLSDTVFIRYLAERWPEPDLARPVTEVAAEFYIGELYLACACLERIPGAIQAFDKEYLARLPASLARMRLPPDLVEDVLQELRIKLFVATPERPPKPERPPRIGDYSGTGELRSWVGICAKRLALDILKTTWEIPEAQETIAKILAEGMTSGLDPESETLFRACEAVLVQALRDVIDALAEDKRTLIKLYHADGLSLVEIGKIYDVNHSTILRRLERIREEIYRATWMRSKERLPVPQEQFNRVMEILRSALDWGLTRILREKET